MTDFRVGVDVRANEYIFITSLNVCLLREYQTYELNITSVVLDNIVRSNQSSLQFD